MKNLAISCIAAVLFAGMAGSVSAAEVLKSSLGSMGLGSMQKLSDSEGLTVRGKGTEASVWGSSHSSFFGNTSTNGYRAESEHRHGSSTAFGANISVAGAAVGTGNGVTHFIVVGAAGTSFAFAK